MTAERDVPQRVCEALGVSFPLLLAGMGGVAGPELVASVSNGGAAGTLGLYKSPVERIPVLLEETARLTGASHGVNFVPEVLTEAELVARVDVVLEAAGPGLFVSFFGSPPPAVALAVRKAGHPLVVQVGTASEAAAAADLGADVLVLQGIEAGGHLLGMDGVEALLRSVRSMLPGAALAVAGGIATGGEFARLAGLGADGVCCGTAFVPTSESRAHPVFKQSVLAASAEDTEITDIFEIGWPGRRHRVIGTPRVAGGRSDPAEFIATTQVYGRPQLIPRYSAAVPTVETTGAVEEMALYCGTSCAEVREEESAAAVVGRFVEEYRSAREAGAAR